MRNHKKSMRANHVRFVCTNNERVCCEPQNTQPTFRKRETLRRHLKIRNDKMSCGIEIHYTKTLETTRNDKKL